MVVVRLGLKDCSLHADMLPDLALMACACQITVETMARISEEQAPHY